MLGRLLAAVNARAGWRWLVWAGLMAALALVLCFMPLFDLLGYDFSLAVGLVATFAAADVGAGVVKAARVQGRDAGVLRLVGEAIALGAALLVLPLVLALLNAIRVKNCNFGSGLLFFLLLPVCSAAYGAGMGTVAALLFPRRGRLLALVLPLVSLAWAGLRLYRDPAVFAYDPFGGYFPGPIYDEALRPPPTLALFRLCNLIWLAAVVAVARAAATAPGGGAAPPQPGPPRLAPVLLVRRWRSVPVAAAALLVASSLVLFALRGSLGFHVRRADLLRVLDGERRSARIVLRYVAAGAEPADLDLAMEDLEFNYDQLRDTLGVEPDQPITIYRFPGPDEKKALVGAGATLYARPWSKEIFVQGDRFPSLAMRHEMAHVFAAEFGDPLLGISLTVRFWGPIPVPRLASGLVEGIAVAADYGDPEGGSTVHQEAAAIVADGRAPPLDTVVGAGFTGVSGPRAYTLAGSFCRYLYDRAGAQKLRALYRSAGDFQGVYGASLASLEADWRGFLRGQKLSAEQRARARERFRRPAIFKKVCAREQAARLAEARGLAHGAPARAIDIYEQACRDDPGEPTIKLELAEVRALRGETAPAIAATGAVERDGAVTSPVRARAAALAASIHFHRGDFDNARAALGRARDAASDEAERRLYAGRLRALEDEPARRTLGRALFGNDVLGNIDPVLTFFLLSEFARLYADEALGQYLVGRQLAGRDPRQSLRFLRAACEPPGAGTGGVAVAPGRPLAPDFRRECRRLTMIAAYRAGDFALSRAAATALDDPSEETAERLRAQDFLARITWRLAKE